MKWNLKFQSDLLWAKRNQVTTNGFDGGSIELWIRPTVTVNLKFLSHSSESLSSKRRKRRNWIFQASKNALACKKHSFHMLLCVVMTYLCPSCLWNDIDIVVEYFSQVTRLLTTYFNLNVTHNTFRLYDMNWFQKVTTATHIQRKRKRERM